MRYLGGLFLFVVGAFIGLKLPDFDIAFRWWPLLMHRSLLTHGLIIPLALFASLRPHITLKQADPRLRLAFMGFCLATAVHLCFDLFPRSWFGFSRIHVPFFGWQSVLFSVLWLGAGALVSLYLACRTFQRISDVGLAMVGLAVCYGVVAAHEPLRSFFALVTLGPMAVSAFLMPRPSHDPDSPSDAISRWKRS